MTHFAVPSHNYMSPGLLGTTELGAKISISNSWSSARNNFEYYILTTAYNIFRFIRHHWTRSTIHHVSNVLIVLYGKCRCRCRCRWCFDASMYRINVDTEFSIPRFQGQQSQLPCTHNCEVFFNYPQLLYYNIQVPIAYTLPLWCIYFYYRFTRSYRTGRSVHHIPALCISLYGELVVNVQCFC